MDHVLLTGATGFVGGRLAHQLLDDGYTVDILARTPSKADDLAARGATVIEGDLTDPASLREAMDGVDGVLHLAAIYELGGDLEQMRAVNVEGTRNVLDAAEAAGVDRVVYCGSDTSLGDTDGEVCDETKEHDGDFRSAYARSKHEAHKLVERRIDDGASVINAIVSSVYGPGDESPIAELIELHLAGLGIAQLDLDAGYTFTHVDDVADALRLAYEDGDIGESYLVSGTPATFEEFFEALSAHTGIPEPRFEVPSWLVDLVEPLAERIAPVLGKSADEVAEMISMGRDVTRFFSAAKAREELGWEPRTLDEGLADTLPSFRAREAESTEQLLEATRWPLGAMALLDLGLGLFATVTPGLYRRLIHPNFDDKYDDGPTYLIRRTGILWLGFAVAQGIAAWDPVERPEWVMASGALRLMDVPADPVYLAAADDLGWISRAALLSAPVFNLASGGLFAYAGLRGLRTAKTGPSPGT